tara:strand:- start:307 stop:978 length:672 start_codon:yes stop_codon:yes gene_type:complete
MFENIYEEIKNLFDNADSEDAKWIEKVSNKLNDIKPLWPEKNITDIANDLSDFEERTEIIHRLSHLPRVVRVEMLAKHGSIHFMFLEKYMDEKDINELLEEYWGNKRGRTKTLIRSAFARLKKRRTEKNAVEKTPDELLSDELNTLPPHYWSELYEDAISWEYNPKMVAILKKLQNTNGRILKKDEMVFIESLRHMVEKNYLKKLSGNSTKAKAYNAILELME